MERQIDCPGCESKRTYPVPETAFMRFCADCDADWDIRSKEELDALDEFLGI